MMPLHRRFPDTKAHGETTQYDHATDHETGSKSKSTPATHPGSAPKGRRSLIFLGLVVMQLVLLMFAAMKRTTKTSASHMPTVLLAAWVTSLPLVLILGVGLGLFGSSSDLPHQRYIPLAVLATIAGNQFPTFLSSGMATCALVVFGLSSRPIPQKKDSDKEKQGSHLRAMLFGPLGTVLAALLMTTVLLIDNFLIWVVSATYKPSQTLSELPTPLQDNGQLLLRHFFETSIQFSKHEIVKLRNMVSVEWILVSGLGLSLVAVELQGTAMRRNLWTMALRGIFTLTIARCIRTFSYLITVLPSQHPNCYFNHFPPPPEDWGSWLMVGFIPQANGGCNDLIISGHATVTSTLACIVTSIVGKPLFTTALWMFVAMDYMVEVYEGFHYSVDMWLGAVLVNFIWTVLAPLEDPTRQQQGVAARKFYPMTESTRSDLIKYSIPALGAYLQLNGLLLSSYQANYTVLVYIFAVVYQISTAGFQQYTQHTLFCLLYMTLGIYL
jgi:hypothetical protein